MEPQPAERQPGSVQTTEPTLKFIELTLGTTQFFVNLRPGVVCEPVSHGGTFKRRRGLAIHERDESWSLVMEDLVRPSYPDSISAS